MANKRKPIGKKLRFEVFKRDSFTCQYCGRTAPDVVLEVDHIKPVCDGGTNEMINLVTSCTDCNRGKGGRPLDDKSEVVKQQEQLKELSEKKEQLEMMLKWREGLLDIKNQELESFCDTFESLVGYSLNDVGKNKAKSWIKKFGIKEILECLDIAVDQYLSEGTPEEAEKIVKYIPRIATNKTSKYSQQIYYFNYIRKVLKSNGFYYSEAWLRSFVNANLVDDDDFSNAKQCLKCSRNWTEFKENLLIEFGLEAW